MVLLTIRKVLIKYKKKQNIQSMMSTSKVGQERLVFHHVIDIEREDTDL